MPFFYSFLLGVITAYNTTMKRVIEQENILVVLRIISRLFSFAKSFIRNQTIELQQIQVA